MMDAPPLLVGTLHETVALVLPRTAVGALGASGIRAGIAPEDGGEESELPTMLCAVTVNVYDVPFVRPLIRQVRVGALTVQVPSAEFTGLGDAVTV
jgi:hypothetical protein